ncbi:MAG: nucleotidyltransferase family protein [Spirosoma sp.]|nr:nucleotidyltransferase family protein [Spirosoma sp.]
MRYQAIATILLAAGRSSRLGQPKQLLRQAGETLVRLMTQMALSLNAGPVVVVVGANEGLIRAEIADFSVQILQNEQWETGMASSLQAGLRSLAHEPVDAFLVLLTDQPHVTSDLLKQLIDTRQQSGRGIVGCQYGEPDFIGVPALFDIGYLPAFMNLTGDTGARKLIRQYADDCAIIPFPLGSVDLDTPDDLANWQNG